MISFERRNNLNRSPYCIFVALLLSSCASALAQISSPTMTVMRVDTKHVLSDISRRPLGININYMTDRPSLFAPGARLLSDALKDMGVHYLRYPGGEKSQSYLWSTPPFKTSRPELSRTGPKEFWSSLRTYTKPDGKTLIDPMSFDEFMTLCRQIGCVPDIVVNHNSYLGPKTTSDARVPTRDQLIQTAAAWVQYANVVKHYGVHYWEVGNETYLNSYNGPRQGPTAYGADVHLFSQAMKHEDPTIKIGAGGDNYEYYRDMLKVAADDIDFLVIHTYPCCASYAAYQKTPRFDGAVEPARKALADLSPAQRAHLGMALTEVNALDFLPGHKDINDLGHAMLLFEILAQFMTYDPDVDFEEVWNTRWIDNNKTSSPPSIFDMLDNKNDLNATGLAMSLLGHGLLTKTIAVKMPQSDGLITGYATADGFGKVRAFIVNRDLYARDLTVQISAISASKGCSKRVFGGNGPDDIHPRVQEAAPLRMRQRAVTMSLPGVSITELTCSK